MKATDSKTFEGWSLNLLNVSSISVCVVNANRLDGDPVSRADDGLDDAADKSKH